MRYTTVKISEIRQHPTMRLDAGYWIKKKSKKKKAASPKLQASSFKLQATSFKLEATSYKLSPPPAGVGKKLSATNCRSDKMPLDTILLDN